MITQAHRLRHGKPRSLKGKIRGAQTVRCSCGWWTISSLGSTGIMAFDQHRRKALAEEVAQAKAEVTLQAESWL